MKGNYIMSYLPYYLASCGQMGSKSEQDRVLYQLNNMYGTAAVNEAKFSAKHMYGVDLDEPTESYNKQKVKTEKQQPKKF